jgi:hypothetical protein
MQFTHKNNGKLHIYAADPNEIHVITYKEVKFLCEKNEIEWKNQTFMQYVKQMKDKFFNVKNGRTPFTTSQRHAILKRFNFKCNKCECEIKDNTYEIDHIRPLANGGDNKASNLQPLCKACHGDKCSNEHETGEYIKIIDSESSFNNHIQSVMDSQLAQTHAFIETIETPKIGADNELDTVTELHEQTEAEKQENKLYMIYIKKLMKYAGEVNIDISPEELQEPIKEPKIFNIDIETIFDVNCIEAEPNLDKYIFNIIELRKELKT